MEKLRILVVEDESLVALEITETIKSFGYSEVCYATNSEMAKSLLQERAFDLILMDINLNEERDGIELYQSLSLSTPIIYLTAYKDEVTIHRAVTTNPLGYLIKPHKEDELKALLLLAQYKIKTSTAQPISSQDVDLGEGYSFDTQEQKLFYNNIFVHLGKKELQLLQLLISAKGNFVSYYTIEHEIWGSDEVSSSTIRTLIYRLRSKLEHKLIDNEAGYGIGLHQFDMP